jgi:hypothetical protein
MMQIAVFNTSETHRMTRGMGLHGDSHWRPGINIYKVINVRHRTDDQLQRAPRAQSVVVYLCVLCELCGFLVLCDSIGFLWGAEDC